VDVLSMIQLSGANVNNWTFFYYEGTLTFSFKEPINMFKYS